MLKEVTKDMLIGEILQADATVAPILMAFVIDNYHIMQFRL